MELPEQDRQALIEAARRRGQGGAAFGVYPSSGKRPEKLNVSRDVNMPAQVARGWVAGTLGLPGDIEGLGRMALGLAGADVSETPVLPTSDFYREYLPGYDPAPAARAASGLGALAGGAGSTKLAGAAVKGAKATGKALGPKAAEMAESYLKKSGLAPELIAYHGTPHRFAPEEGAPLGKFKSEKIGTGEGAQAYGHGLYLAESPGVAESYRKALSDNVFTIGGKDIKGPASKYGQPAQNIIRSELSMPEKMATYALDSAIKAGSNDPAADAIKHLTRHGKGNPDVESALDMVRQWEQQGGKVEAGNLYTVDIPDEKIAKMLDLDRPISEQPLEVQKALSNVSGTEYAADYFAKNRKDAPTGADMQEFLRLSGMNPPEIAAKMREAGIPGVRYFDEQSRNLASDAYYGLKRMQDKVAKLEAEYKDNPSEALKDRIEDAKQELKSAERGVSDLTRNIVVFPGEEESVKIIERKAEGGLVQDTDAIAAKLTGMDKDKALTHALRMANAKQEAHMAAGGLAKLLKGAKKAEEATKAAKATEKAAEAAKPAVKGPQAEALETARKNAVKMLGLPENNTAMDRARALGFDTEAYKGMHPYDPNTGEIWGVRNGRFVPVENIGAEPEVIRSIDPTRTSKMELGGRHAGFFGGKDIANAFAGYTSKNSAVFPVLLNMGKNPEIFEGAGKYAGAFQFERPAGMNNNLDEYKRFQRAFFSDSPSSGAVIKDTVDEGTIFIPRAGNQVRSRFAAFDPARVNENDLLGAADPALLAGTAVASGIGLGALGQMSKPKPKQEDKKKAAGGLAKRM